MLRKPLIVLTLIALLWQAVAMGRPGSWVAAVADIQHAVMHWQGESHRHHSDGSFHPDQSDDAARHMLADNVSGTAVLLSTATVAVAVQGERLLAPWSGAHVPQPPPEGILRPPRAIA